MFKGKHIPASGTDTLRNTNAATVHKKRVCVPIHLSFFHVGGKICFEGRQQLPGKVESLMLLLAALPFGHKVG